MRVWSPDGAQIAFVKWLTWPSRVVAVRST